MTTMTDNNNHADNGNENINEDYDKDWHQPTTFLPPPSCFPWWKNADMGWQ